MIDRLFVFLLTPPEAEMPQVYWRAVDPAAPDSATADLVNNGSGTLEEFSKIVHEHFPDTDIALVVSGLQVTYTNVAITVKNQKQMLLALPYMVEEQVIGNIEDMHIAVPEKFSGDSVRIAIMDKALLDTLRENFSRYNLVINELFGMPDLLAIQEDELHILLSENISLVKDREYCFQCDRENIETLLDLIPKESISRVIISLNEQDKKSLSIAKKIKIVLSSDSVEVKSSIFSEAVLDYIANQAGASVVGPLNLLQGSISASSVTSQKIKEYAPVAWVAMLCWMLQLGFNFSSGFYFSRDSAQIEKNSEEQYIKLFPEEKNIVNLESQLKGKINAYDLNSKNTNFASVFALTISVMTKVGNKDDIHLKQFRYDQESGELKIGFDASSITLLDKIKKNLTDSDMSVEIVSANEENGVIKATLSIKHV